MLRIFFEAKDPHVEVYFYANIFLLFQYTNISAGHVNENAL